MAVFLVTWDLNKEKPNYSAARDKVIAALSKCTHAKDSGLDSVWFVDTTSSIHEIYDYLAPNFDSNDRLVITHMKKGDYHGWLSTPAWTWINARSL